MAIAVGRSVDGDGWWQRSAVVGANVHSHGQVGAFAFRAPLPAEAVLGVREVLLLCF